MIDDTIAALVGKIREAKQIQIDRLPVIGDAKIVYEIATNKNLKPAEKLTVSYMALNLKYIRIIDMYSRM